MLRVASALLALAGAGAGVCPEATAALELWTKTGSGKSKHSYDKVIPLFSAPGQLWGSVARRRLTSVRRVMETKIADQCLPESFHQMANWVLGALVGRVASKPRPWQPWIVLARVDP